MQQKKCIIIEGPTAVGKTKLAIELAQYYNTAVISADSRQCYRELNIGVAKPTNAELGTVHHYFINSHSIHREFNAADFEQYALNSAAEVFAHSDTVILTGGTGLYIKAFCSGMDAIPAIDAGIRHHVISNYNERGMAWLCEEVKQTDPVYFAAGEVQNPQRLMRALEVKLGTGQSILDFQQGQKKERPFDIYKFALEMPREQLYDRINQRVVTMMEEGLLEEAKGLVAYKNLNALQTVGYRELFAYLEGEFSLEKAVTLIQQNTRHYAKRQLTWFKKEKDVHWIEATAQAVDRIVKAAEDYRR